MVGSCEKNLEYYETRRRMIENLRLSGSFFISPDFTAARGLTIFPGQVSELSVVTEGVSEDLIKFRLAHLAVRSRGAQAGLNLRIKQDELLVGHRLLLEAEALGQRPIEISQGDKLGRFYYEYGALLLNGSDLELFCNQNIHNKVKSNKVNDWFLVDLNSQPVDSTDIIHAFGVGLFLDEDVDLHVSQGPSLAIFGDSIRDYRGLLDTNVLRPTRNGIEEPGLHISQTRATVTLPENVNGILEYGLENIPAAHVESHLIEGGKTNWPLRIEYVRGSLREPFKGRPYVVMHLFRDRI